MDQGKIGRFIATCRKENGLTQVALAEKLGITDRAVSKWENGKSLPDPSIMLELCELLGINVNELLTGKRLNMENDKEILEEIRCQVGCDFISNLRFGYCSDEAKAYFADLDYSKFKPEEVLDAFHYIFPDTENIKTIEEMNLYIKDKNEN